MLYRVPDVLDKAARIMAEVKNARLITYTSQLADYVAYAQAEGLAFYLFVRAGASLSPAVQAAVDRGLIILRTIPLN